MEGVFISDIQLIFSVLKFPFNSFLKTSFFSTKKCFPSFQVHLLLPHGSVLKSNDAKAETPVLWPPHAKC